MNTWRPKKNGVNETTQFMRYQNDFFHNAKMTMIKRRKNQFVFPLIAKPQTSYQTSRNSFKIEKDNSYLSNKLRMISKRLLKPLNTFFLDLSSKQNQIRKVIRSSTKDKINQENMLYVNRLMHTQSIINHRSLEKDFISNRNASRNLKKIEPLITN